MQHRFPIYGWIGLAGLAAGETLILLGHPWMATWFTPWMWTAYILTADALVFGRTGASWLTTRRREVPLLILCSVGVWILFEAYNLHLVNWVYVNVPADALVRFIAYFWSFATIMPGVFETAALLASLRSFNRVPLAAHPQPFSAASSVAFIAGLALVSLPLAIPRSTAAYLFALVWIGYIPLLESLNLALGATSPMAAWLQGNRKPIVALLIAGFVCGLLWEAWNYQAFVHAGAYWVYTIPEPLRLFGLHYGQMPLLGLGGFPPFALELAAFYAFIHQVLGGQRVFGPRSA